jgi:hypothetical protein
MAVGIGNESAERRGIGIPLARRIVAREAGARARQGQVRACAMRLRRGKQIPVSKTRRNNLEGQLRVQTREGAFCRRQRKTTGLVD